MNRDLTLHTRDGGYSVGMVSAYPQVGLGRWDVYIDLTHVAFGKRYQHLSAKAVIDDFGDLVLIGNANGEVVMS